MCLEYAGYYDNVDLYDFFEPLLQQVFEILDNIEEDLPIFDTLRIIFNALSRLEVAFEKKTDEGKKEIWNQYFRRLAFGAYMFVPPPEDLEKEAFDWVLNVYRQRSLGFFDAWDY